MSLVRVSSLGQHLVELPGADIETVIVFSSAIEVDFQAVEFLRVLSQGHRIVGFPIRQILTDAVNPLEQRLKHLQPPVRYARGGEIGEQYCAMAANRSEQIR